MNKNKNLNVAAKNKKDEFYTQLADIERELKHYWKHFKNKIVLCNCDDPYESEFFKYFAVNFNFLGLKKLIATCYKTSPIAQTELKFFDEVESENKKAFAVEINEVKDWNEDGRIDLSDVEFLLKNNKNVVKFFKGDGDFRSQECIELLKKSDVVVTNPPFSLFREYVKQLIDFDKKFLILGNKNAITYKEIFPLIKNNKMWTGYTSWSGGLWFITIDENNFDKISDGKKLKNVPSIWFTNLDLEKRHEDIILWKNYSPEEFPKYDNYDAIEVSKTVNIPCDYFGVMGVPITFLDKYNPEQFEIIGMAKRGAGDPKLRTKIYTKEDYENYSDLNAGPVLNVNGILKNTYPRILIRRRR